MLRWALWLLLLEGCVGDGKTEVDADGDGVLKEDDCDDGNTSIGAASTFYTDADGDGFGDDNTGSLTCPTAGLSTVGGDCNDGDANTYPEATEPCEEEVDRNCDGQLSFEDGDGDSFPSCLDCDDNDAGVYPEAVEHCDGEDEDCDGETDEDAIDMTTFYPDEDGDGFGVETGSGESCAGPAGYATEGGDCDDARANVNPDAQEDCSSPYDDNCDGDSNEVNAQSCSDWFEDLDGDHYGGLARSCLCEGTEIYTTDNGGDCDDGDTNIHPEATEDCGTTADDNCDGSLDAIGAVDCTDWFEDYDGDSYGSLAQCSCEAMGAYTATLDGDCDDSLATVNPGATEDCATADDDNCDSSYDAMDALGCTDWYGDADGDGYGAGSSLCSCSQPAGYPSANALDCDDGLATVSPSQSEDCSTAADDNCNGDYNDVGALSCSDYYLDADGDGYGEGSSQCTCTAAGSYSSSDSSDCDDGNSTVHPDATETCATTDDDDCDGDSNEVNAQDCTDWYPDGDGDGYGAGTAICACSSSASSSAGDDCDDTTSAVNPGASEVCRNGVDDNCDGDANTCVPSNTALSTGSILYTGENTDDNASRVSMIGDFDNDGYDDMFVGAPYSDDGGIDIGVGYLVKGSSSPHSGSLTNATAQYINTYAAGGLYSGSVVAAAGDFDQDGFDDALMGGDDQYTFLIRGSSSPSSGYLTGAIRWAGASNSDSAGDALSGGGDVNGDSFPDVLLGAWSADTSSSNAGSVYVMLGSSAPASGTVTGNIVLSGENQNDYLGYSVANVWDVDGDGKDDMLLGGVGNDDGGSSAGAAWLIFGDSSLASSSVAGQVQYTGLTYRDEAGYVAGPGDVNGDGYADMLIGGPGYDGGGSDGGAAWLIYGSSSPSSRSLSTYDARILGDSASLGIGMALAGAGDVNADGYADLILGGNYSTTGGAWLVLGESNLGSVAVSAADALYTGEQANDAAGSSVAGGGDVDADGYDDLLIGAPGNDDGATDGGTIYLIRGIGL